MLLELVTSHSDDWFTFPIAATPGHVLTLHEALVVDAPDERWTLRPPDDGWTLFATTGLDPSSLVLWPAVTTPLIGPVIDQIDLGHDEDANMVWAVERRVAGRDKLTLPRPTEPTAADGDTDVQPRYAYRPSTDLSPFWHPYVIDDVNGRRRLVLGRLAGNEPPTSDLLRDPANRGEYPAHQIEPAAIPTDGLSSNAVTCWGARSTADRCCGRSGGGCRSPHRRRCTWRSTSWSPDNADC